MKKIVKQTFYLNSSNIREQVADVKISSDDINVVEFQIKIMDNDSRADLPATTKAKIEMNFHQLDKIVAKKNLEIENGMLIFQCPAVLFDSFSFVTMTIVLVDSEVDKSLNLGSFEFMVDRTSMKGISDQGSEVTQPNAASDKFTIDILDTPPEASEQGEIYYDTQAKAIKIFNGTNWVDVVQPTIVDGQDVVVDVQETEVFDQPVASDIWEITHSLNKYPSVTVVDSTNRTVEGGAVTYISPNKLICKFSAPFSGQAILN